jgi:putative lipoic acid-binding regulatory protein
MIPWQVNTYPGVRSFTAIGSGGEEFRASMLKSVVDVVGTVHYECISQRASTTGKYLSVTVGPVWLVNGDQV